ncbi:DNA cytosine methyltransferase [Clostridium amazonitimonense]|uniref:DNA cytosine methyltransferase n=1 Tax=Clostridium amazonitimonense TaxID=1499689 RepID=UPI0005095F0F|nr:DNA cytosine methyltransferase [Clostridium amazonitimonense]
MNNNDINVIDLFCGCGGLSYGFEMAGYNVLLGIDNDKMALETFKLNHKNSKIICGDITEIKYTDIINLIGDKQIDLIVGGPPCQGMSLSGPRKFHDPRNKLYLSFIRLVEEIQPKGFVIENVPGLISLFGGAIKDSILQEFSRLGYKVEYKVLNAAEYGVPQFRKRVIFVGLKEGVFSFPEPTHNENNYVSCGMAISDLPSLDKDYLGAEEEGYESLPICDYQVTMRDGSKKLFNHVAAKHSEQVKHVISLVPEGGNYKNLPNEYKDTRKFNVAWTRFDSKKPAPTIDTGHRHHFHYKLNRVPTVRESARIQSFPDKFVFLGNKTQQFRQVGNAVPPILAQKIAEQIKKYL